MRARLRHETGRLNKTEAAYARELAVDPAVASFRFEAHKLRLADSTWYTPDFEVLLETGQVEFHEVKVTWKRKSGEFTAAWEDDSRVKFKVAAEQFPEYVFRVARLRHKAEGGGFEVEEA